MAVSLAYHVRRRTLDRNRGKYSLALFLFLSTLPEFYQGVDDCGPADYRERVETQDERHQVFAVDIGEIHFYDSS